MLKYCAIGFYQWRIAMPCSSSTDRGRDCSMHLLYVTLCVIAIYYGELFYYRIPPVNALLEVGVHSMLLLWNCSDEQITQFYKLNYCPMQCETTVLHVLIYFLKQTFGVLYGALLNEPIQ